MNTTGSERDNVKQKNLNQLLFESELTVNSLLFLKDSPRTIEQLFTYLNITEKTLLTHLVELQDYYLIKENGDKTYNLSTIGNIIVDKMTPLLHILDEIEGNENSHD